MERPLNLIIWPEASVPTFVAKYPALQEALASVVPENGFILVGGPRYEDHTEQTIFTSLLALDQRGQIVDTYDKTHLVPFGEYVPFKHYLPIAKLSPGERDYSPGSGLKLMKLPGIPNFTPLICFEAIFPGHVTPPHEAGRPEWLLNQTNDAWYGRSTGPYQHLQIVRVRAIEEALPLVRSANNGISADIDPHGRILHHLELDDIGFLDFDLPKAAAPTPYSRFGEVFYFLMLLLVTGWALLVNRRGRQPTG
jgi:apolipoprotein N-acyltransferase